MIYLADQFLGVECDTKNPIVKTDGSTSDNNRNHCNARGWITRDTFLPHMQRTTLKVRISTGKVLSVSAQVLPWALEELRCETTSLGPYDYIWDSDYVLSGLRTEDVNIMELGTKYYIISGHDSTTISVFEFKNNPRKLCGEPTDIYRTNYVSLHVAIISGGFDLRSGRNLGKKRNSATQLLQYIGPTENNGFAQIYAYDPKHTSHETSDEDKYLIMDYEMHMGTKLDYLFFQSSRLLQASEIQLLKNQCEEERTQIPTILMLFLESTRLAGCMLTENRSMFPETDGSLAWMYHCPLVHSPLRTMNQCYDRITILYEDQFQIVDPITRQTQPADNLQNCTDRIKNLFQFNMDQEDSWFTLTPGIVHQDRPADFGPKDVSPAADYSFPGSQDAGLNTRNELSSFWDSIGVSAASWNASKNSSQKLIVFSNNNKNPDSFPYYAPRTDFFVDNMISPGYFKDRFMDTLGPVAYVFEHCGSYFSVFLVFKPNIDVVVMVIHQLEITKITGASLGFGKTLLSASYNIFVMSVLTSIYDPRAPTLSAVEEERKTLSNQEESNDMRKDSKKKEEQLNPAVNPAHYHQFATPIPLFNFILIRFLGRTTLNFSSL